MTQIEVTLMNSNKVDTFVRFICEELRIQPKTITVIPYECDDGVSGLCYDETEEDYIIFVRESGRDIGQIFTTIAHEMVHVKQYIKENLNDAIHNYSHIPYMERWWEQEAYGKSYSLVEKFVKSLTK